MYKPLAIVYLYFQFQREGRHRNLGRGKRCIWKIIQIKNFTYICQYIECMRAERRYLQCFWEAGSFLHSVCSQTVDKHTGHKSSCHVCKGSAPEPRTILVSCWRKHRSYTTCSLKILTKFKFHKVVIYKISIHQSIIFIYTGNNSYTRKENLQ